MLQTVTGNRDREWLPLCDTTKHPFAVSGSHSLNVSARDVVTGNKGSLCKKRLAPVSSYSLKVLWLPTTTSAPLR